jgi:hypothetical protein
VVAGGRGREERVEEAARRWGGLEESRGGEVRWRRRWLAGSRGGRSGSPGGEERRRRAWGQTREESTAGG